MSLLEMFCDIDGFWQTFQPIWESKQLKSGERQRRRTPRLNQRSVSTFHDAQSLSHNYPLLKLTPSECRKHII